jgi:hypothetical protein
MPAVMSSPVQVQHEDDGNMLTMTLPEIDSCFSFLLTTCMSNPSDAAMEQLLHFAKI